MERPRDRIAGIDGTLRGRSLCQHRDGNRCDRHVLADAGGELAAEVVGEGRAEGAEMLGAERARDRRVDRHLEGDRSRTARDVSDAARPDERLSAHRRGRAGGGADVRDPGGEGDTEVGDVVRGRSADVLDAEVEQPGAVLRIGARDERKIEPGLAGAVEEQRVVEGPKERRFRIRRVLTGGRERVAADVRDASGSAAVVVDAGDEVVVAHAGCREGSGPVRGGVVRRRARVSRRRPCLYGASGE